MLTRAMIETQSSGWSAESRVPLVGLIFGFYFFSDYTQNFHIWLLANRIATRQLQVCYIRYIRKLGEGEKSLYVIHTNHRKEGTSAREEWPGG
eukprot:6152197-Pleurochrysis_carterae.AAC.1